MANIFPKGTNETVIKAGLALSIVGGLVTFGRLVLLHAEVFARRLSAGAAGPFSARYPRRPARPRLPLLPQLCRSQRPLQYSRHPDLHELPPRVQKNNPKLQPVRDSWATGKPIAWVKIHNVPDYAFFNHSAHVNRGVSCVSCHGKVNEMNVVFQDESQSMALVPQLPSQPAGIRPAHRRRHAGRSIARFLISTGRRRLA